MQSAKIYPIIGSKYLGPKEVRNTQTGFYESVMQPPDRFMGLLQIALLKK